jgi:hypothetical protein
VNEQLVGASFDVAVGSFDVQEDPWRVFKEFWYILGGLIVAALGWYVAARRERRKSQEGKA